MGESTDAGGTEAETLPEMRVVEVPNAEMLRRVFFWKDCVMNMLLQRFGEMLDAWWAILSDFFRGWFLLFLVATFPAVLVCLTGCELLNRIAPVPPIETYSDQELAEELLGRGFNELEGLLGDLFGEDD